MTENQVRLNIMVKTVIPGGIPQSAAGVFQDENTTTGTAYGLQCVPVTRRGRMKSALCMSMCM